jgi:hypothetical protein
VNRIASAFVVIGLFCSACFEKGDCQNQTSNLIKLDFFSYTTLRSKTILIDSVTIAGLDSAFYRNTNLSSITLPLDPVSSAADISIHSPEGLSQFEFNYQTQTSVLDPACGAVDIFKLGTASGQGFDSLKIIQNILSKPSSTNVRIYF